MGLCRCQLKRGHNLVRVDDVLVREGVGHRRIGGISCDDGGEDGRCSPKLRNALEAGGARKDFASGNGKE